MSENKTVCHCMNVSVADIEKVVHEAKHFSSVEQAFGLADSAQDNCFPYPD